MTQLLPGVDREGLKELSDKWESLETELQAAIYNHEDPETIARLREEMSEAADAFFQGSKSLYTHDQYPPRVRPEVSVAPTKRRSPAFLQAQAVYEEAIQVRARALRDHAAAIDAGDAEAERVFAIQVMQADEMATESWRAMLAGIKPDNKPVGCITGCFIVLGLLMLGGVLADILRLNVRPRLRLLEDLVGWLPLVIYIVIRNFRPRWTR